MWCFRHRTHVWWFASVIFARGGFPQQIWLLQLRCVQYVCVCLCVVVCSSCFGSPVCLCSSGWLAAEEPGQCSERGPVRSHPHTEEKASEHPELHTGSAQERPLETTGPAGKHQQHMDAINCSIITSYLPNPDLKSADSMTCCSANITGFEFQTKKQDISCTCISAHSLYLQLRI